MNTDKLKQLVAAGEKATQGEWVFIKKQSSHDLEYSDRGGYTIESDIGVFGETVSDDSTYYNTAPEIDDAKFFVQAANCREDLKQLLEYVDGLEAVLKDIKKESGNAFPTDEMNIIYSLAKQALEGKTDE